MAWSRPLGRVASRKEGAYGVLLSRNWVEGRRDHFRGLGKLEGDIQFRTTSRESLQSKACCAALLPEVYHMGELVLSKSMGSWGPGSLGGHGR